MDFVGFYNKYFFRLILVFSGCILLAALFYAWDSWQRLNSSINIHKASASTESMKVFSTHKMLAGSHLFGIPVIDSAVDIPKSQLQVELKGVMLGASDIESIVIIGVTGQTDQVYKVGDKLKDTDVIVHGILRNAVVLENAGHLEKVILPINKLQFKKLL